MTNPLDLNARDCDQLLETIDAWEGQPASEGFSSIMMGAMLGGFSGTSKEERNREIHREKDEMLLKQRKRKEDCAFLRAKLIQLRNRLREPTSSPF